MTTTTSGGPSAGKRDIHALRAEIARLVADVGVTWSSSKISRVAKAYEFRAQSAGQPLGIYLQGVLIEQGHRQAAARIPVADRANAAGHTDKTGETATWNVHLEEGIHP